MSKYAKKTRRSRRKQAEPTGEVRELDTAKGSVTMQLPLPLAEILAGVHGAVEEVAGQAGLLIMQALIEDEVERLAGPRYMHDPSREATRWGSEESHVVLGGRKAPCRRPRVRQGGKDVHLERLRLFQAPGRMQEAVSRKVLCRVSTRKYESAVDELCDGYGIRRSSVSRHWKAAGVKRLEELMEAPVGDDFVAILIDGIDFKGHLLVVALGVDSSGQKRVLGLWAGATENTELCQSLLEDLVRRGLPTDRKYLFVLDGS
jgi:transposase-like protein